MNNYTLLIGRIANEIEVTRNNDGVSTAKLTLAVIRPFKNTETNVYDKDYIDITLWEHIAINTAEYCKKNDMVAVKCRVSSRNELGKDDTSFKQIELIAERVLFLSANGKSFNMELKM